MGNITIKVDIQNEKVEAKILANKPTISDFSVALAQLELIKINLMGKIAKSTQMKIEGDGL